MRLRPPIPSHLRVSDPSVLIDFTEEVLTIDELQWAPPEVIEPDVACRELLASSSADVSDQVRFIVSHRNGRNTYENRSLRQDQA